MALRAYTDTNLDPVLTSVAGGLLGAGVLFVSFPSTVAKYSEYT